MSDIMTPIPFGNLMNWILEEHRKGAVFGVRKPFKADPEKNYEIFGRKLETPFGPAAGPHTQLTQNTARTFRLQSHASRRTTSAITVSGPRSCMFPRPLTSM